MRIGWKDKDPCAKLGLGGLIINGKAPQAKVRVEELLKDGKTPDDILLEGMIPEMRVVSEKFKNNEFYVPEVLIASRAFKACMELLREQMPQWKGKTIGRIALGAVRGDLHDIGKNVVSMYLEAWGFEIEDLGVDVKPEQFVEAVERGADIIAMTALLTTTMPAMRDTIEALKAAGLRDQVKVMIGGAPVTQNYAKEIGADGYGYDHLQAVVKAYELMGLKPPF